MAKTLYYMAFKTLGEKNAGSSDLYLMEGQHHASNNSNRQHPRQQPHPGMGLEHSHSIQRQEHPPGHRSLLQLLPQCGEIET